LPHKCYSRCHKATDEEDDRENTWKRDPEREMWTAGFRFIWRKMVMQYKTERGGDKWSVA